MHIPTVYRTDVSFFINIGVYGSASLSKQSHKELVVSQLRDNVINQFITHLLYQMTGREFLLANIHITWTGCDLLNRLEMITSVR